jgi:hypothetical protein
MWSESRVAGVGQVYCFNALGFLNNPRIERVVAHIYIYLENFRYFVIRLKQKIWVGLKVSKMSKSRWQMIKNLDAFPRAEEHLMQKTSSGAAG